MNSVLPTTSQTPEPTTAALRATPKASSAGGFATALNSARSTSSNAMSELREAAQQMVASAFILPLLQQVRDDPFKSDLFHGGKSEDLFGQQLDTILADRIVDASRLGVADAIVDRMSRVVMGRQAYQNQTTDPQSLPQQGASPTSLKKVDLHG